MTAVVDLAPELRGFGGIHGGHLAAIALEHSARAAADPERVARSLTLTLVSAADGGALHVDAAVERAGSALTTTSVRLAQGGRAIAFGAATFGAARPGITRRDRAMPDVPPPGDCVPLVEAPVAEAQGLPIEHRPAAAPLPLAGSDDARIAVWMRRRADEPLDAAGLALLADGAVPALFGAIDTFIAMPTVELSVQLADVGAAAASPWVLGVFTNVDAADGYAVEDAELWTPGGALVLTGRQLRRVQGTTG